MSSTQSGHEHVTQGKVLTRGFEKSAGETRSTSYHTSKRAMFTSNRINGEINFIVSQSCRTALRRIVMGWIL